MNKNILVVGLACLSAVAVAQSDGSQQKSASPSSNSQQVTSPRDAATGQASGKRMIADAFGQDLPALLQQ